ncbi:MAG TPA: hypothetical protein VEJ41_01165 [Candidatus Acidoferrales bacterium]|nr:hypothetical protein [Candidatus Acidoferrales bacterium]
MAFIRADQLVEIDVEGPRRADLLERAHHGVRWDWFGRPVEFRSNLAGAVDALRSRYQAFLTSASPQLTSCAVAPDDEPPTFFTDPGEAFSHPMVLNRPGPLAFLADAVTTRAFFEVHPTLWSFHAAALRVGDVAVAISATSTGGKSTTAFACARRGMGLYSDERCVIEDGRALPFPRAVNLRSGGIELLAAEDVPDPFGLGLRLRAHGARDWESAQIADVLGASQMPAPATLANIFFITDRADRPSAQPLGLEPALKLLLGASFAGPRPGMDRLAAATQLLRQARAFALTLGSPDDTAQLVAATASKSRALPVAASA